MLQRQGWGGVNSLSGMFGGLCGEEQYIQPQTLPAQALSKQVACCLSSQGNAASSLPASVGAG